jgi:hypothetical protein
LLANREVLRFAQNDSMEHCRGAPFKPSVGLSGDQKIVIPSEGRYGDRSRGTCCSNPMFLRKLQIDRIDESGQSHPCPIHWIDNFAMRNFTNDAIFDDTLPIGDGFLEVGLRVPLDRLQTAMQDWFRRKGYLKAGEALRVSEPSSVDC